MNPIKRDYKHHAETKHDPFNSWTKKDVLELAGAGFLFLLMYFILTIVFCF